MKILPHLSVSRGDVEKCIKDIAGHLGLPIAVNITYVSEEYNSNSGSNFESRHVVKTNSAGRGTQGIIAQVAIPNSLPLYGSQALKDFTVNIKLGKNLSGKSRFITVMAHELSHVVLYSLRHPKKENEFYTDITAMLLGFLEIMEQGRKDEETWTEKGRGFKRLHTKVTRFGYLSDQNFDFAAVKIKRLIGEKNLYKFRLNREFRELKTLYMSYLNAIEDVKSYLSELDRKPRHNFQKDDLQKIILMHQPDYFSKSESTRSFYAGKLERINSFLNGQFLRESYEHIKETENELSSLMQRLQATSEKMNSDRSILRKYIGIWMRLKSPTSR